MVGSTIVLGWLSDFLMSASADDLCLGEISDFELNEGGCTVYTVDGGKYGATEGNCQGKVIGRCLYDDGHRSYPMEVRDCIGESHKQYPPKQYHDQSCFKNRCE